ncbi:MAG: hypothetical protein K9H16_10340 [Bacteroidales bacterium]|nr:hypothetical protein [Bacteroidales bacterium]
MSKLLDKMALSGLVTPPNFITKSFSTNFPAAVNLEWNLSEFGFEAIFQENGHELIAQFNKYGALAEVRKNIKADELPARLLELLKDFGELMNLIVLTKKSQVQYEVIYRDKQLNRFLLLMSSEGKILQNEQL